MAQEDGPGTNAMDVDERSLLLPQVQHVTDAMKVDTDSDGGTGSPAAATAGKTAKAKSTPRPKKAAPPKITPAATERAQSKPSSSRKSKQKPAALSALNSAASSPGPSSIAHDPEQQQHVDSSGEQTRESSPHRPSFDQRPSMDQHHHLLVRSSSSLSSLGPSPSFPALLLPTISMQQEAGPETAIKNLAFLPALEAAFAARRTGVRAFDEYVPASRLAQQQKEEEDEARRLAKKRVMKGKARAEEKEAAAEEEEEGEQDMRLHCRCKSVYDPNRAMIACDRCEDWFHFDCLQFDGHVDLVDQFICPLCEKDTTERTNWKQCCDRPTCIHPVAPLSKYCSDYCGIEVAATRIELSGIDPERFWSKVAAARRKEGALLDAMAVGSTVGVTETSRMRSVDEEEDERTLASLKAKRASFVDRQAALNLSCDLIDARLRYLRMTIRRWESLCQLTAQGLAAEGLNDLDTKSASSSSLSSKQKGKKAAPNRRGATTLPNAQCGFDLRLVYDAKDWEAWVAGEEGISMLAGEEEAGMEIIAGVCLETRKRCDRHTGWQKVREADFEVEKAVLNRRREYLSNQEKLLQQQIEDHQASSSFKNLHRGRKGAAIDISNVKQLLRDSQSHPSTPHSKSIKSLKVERSQGHGSTTPTAADAEGDYEIPEEVLQFMTLAERMQYRNRSRR